MPYPNEHALRLKSPGLFDPDSFRRTDGGRLFGGRIKVPASIGLLWAKLKGRAKPSDPPILQAIRFKKGSWSVAAAKAWIKKNIKMKGIFEPGQKTEGKGEEVSGTDPMDEVVWDEDGIYETGDPVTLTEILSAEEGNLITFEVEVTEDSKNAVLTQLAELMSDHITASEVKTQKSSTSDNDPEQEQDDGESETTDLAETETHTIDDVEILRIGTWKGDKYTRSDLDTIATNFQKLRKQVKPPCILGHGVQALLNNSGLNAAGWISKVARVGDKLLAQLSDVPRVVADLIRKKAYRRVSLEIYPNYQAPDGTRYGLTLARLALLGGDIPAVKSLKDIEALYTDTTENNEIRRLLYMANPDDKDTVAGEEEVAEEAEEEDRKDEKEEEKSFTATEPKEAPKKGGESRETIPPEITAELAETRIKMAEMQKQVTSAGKIIETLQDQVTEQRDKAASIKDEQFLDKLTESGKFPPALRAKSLVLLSELRKAENSFTYSEPGEGDGAEAVDVETTETALFMDILDALPTRIEMGETATKPGEDKTTGDDDKESRVYKHSEDYPVKGLDVVDAVNEYMEEHEGTNYADALEVVSRAMKI